MSFDVTQNKINKKLDIQPKCGNFTKNCIKEIIRLKESVIVTHVLLRDFFSILRDSGYLWRYPTIMDYTDTIWNRVFLIEGEVRIHEQIKFGVFTYSDNYSIMVRIGENDATCEILDPTGTTILLVPFVKDGKIVDLYNKSTLDEIGDIKAEHFLELKDNILDFINGTITTYIRQLDAANKEFDFYMAALLSRYEGMVDNGIRLDYVSTICRGRKDC